MINGPCIKSSLITICSCYGFKTKVHIGNKEIHESILPTESCLHSLQASTSNTSKLLLADPTLEQFVMSVRIGKCFYWSNKLIMWPNTVQWCLFNAHTLLQSSSPLCSALPPPPSPPSCLSGAINCRRFTPRKMGHSLMCFGLS